jgi:hypothetical protein
VEGGEQPRPIHERHLDVGQDDLRSHALPRREAGPPVAGRGHEESSLGQNVSRHGSPIIVVVDDEHRSNAQSHHLR